MSRVEAIVSERPPALPAGQAPPGRRAARNRLRQQVSGWIVRPRPSPVTSWLLITGAVVAVAAIGLADSFTPDDVSVAPIYLLPAVLVTILVSTTAGLALAAYAAVTWAAADTFLKYPPSALESVGNALLRFACFTVVVVLLAGLRWALAEAQASDRRSREFLGYAAHQLRTPVSGLRSSAEVLIMAGVAPDQERLLANLAAESDRIGRLVASLLQMARLDQGEPVLLRPVDVARLCADEVDRARDGSPALEFELDGAGAPVFGSIDPEATEEALSNLLDNARRHARSWVRVLVRATPEAVEIVVADDGPGLPAGSERRAFERFVSLDGRGGSGLGLPIARSLVESQGGELVYRDGQFVVRLPVHGRS